MTKRSRTVPWRCSVKNTATRSVSWILAFPANCAAARTSQRTGDIGMFKIIAETGVAAGVRRVEAITGDNTLAWVQAQNDPAEPRRRRAGAPAADLPDRIAQVQEQVKSPGKRPGPGAQPRWPPTPATTWLPARLTEIKGIKVLARRYRAVPIPRRCAAWSISSRTSSSRRWCCWRPRPTGKISVVGGVTADLTGRIKAGDLVGFVSDPAGRQGRRPSGHGHGGGSDAAALAAAIASVRSWWG